MSDEHESNGRLPNGGNREREDRDERGRFLPGCAGGPGNPFARKVAALREALLAAIGPADVAAVVSKLVELAKGGDVAAAREVLQRTVGQLSPEVLVAMLQPAPAPASELRLYPAEKVLLISRVFEKYDVRGPLTPDELVALEAKVTREWHAKNGHGGGAGTEARQKPE